MIMDYSNFSMVAPEDVKETAKGINRELKDKVTDLKRKNNNVWYIQSGAAFVGSIGGLVYAINKKKSFWGKVGWWILGGMIGGVPTGVAAHLINSKRNGEIDKLNNEIEDLEGVSSFDAYKFKALYGDPSDVKSFDTSDMSVTPNDLG